MRSRTRKLLGFSAVLLVIAAIGLAVYLRKRAAPEPARLLPNSDVVFYVNLGTVRHLTSFGKNPVNPEEPEYKDFIRETGFQFERDLEEAAFAVHYLKHPPARKGEPETTEARYSEVFVGKFDGQKLTDYLRKISKAAEHYGGTEIYAIPVENRTVRVAILGVDSVAASNVDDSAVIHGIVDRAHAAAMPFQGPAVVREYYHKVPLGSLVWAVARIPAGGNPVGSLSLPGGLDIQMIPAGSTVVASARYLGSIHARADIYTPTADDAQKLAQQAATFLTLFRSAQLDTQPGGIDPDLKTAFDSLKTSQEDSRATISATIPIEFFKKLLSEPPDVTGEKQGTPSQQEERPTTKAPLPPKSKPRK